MPGWVRNYQLAADVDGEIVGRVSLRFELNDYCASEAATSATA